MFVCSVAMLFVVWPCCLPVAMLLWPCCLSVAMLFVCSVAMLFACGHAGCLWPCFNSAVKQTTWVDIQNAL